MMRASKIVRAMTEGETVFPFETLTAEPGKSWRKKSKAFKNADRIEALGYELSTHKRHKVWDAHAVGFDVCGLQIRRLAAADLQSGAREHSAARDVGGGVSGR